MERAGLQLREDQLDRLWRYHLLLDERNPELDLTRIKGLRNVAIKHFLDCAIVPGLVALPSPLLDIGTGPGFPGIVLKVVQPELDIILAEPRHKRVSFLREVVRELNLVGIEIFPHKVVGDHLQPVAGVITRALETIAATLERVQGVLDPGGFAYFMKGPSVDPELLVARRKLRHVYELVDDMNYVLPGTTYKRRLVVYRRI